MGRVYTNPDPDDEDLLIYMGLDPSKYDTKQARERRRQAKKEARQDALKSKLSFITNALASETTETSPTINNSNMNRMARRQNAKLNKSSSKKDFIERSSNVVTDELINDQITKEKQEISRLGISIGIKSGIALTTSAILMLSPEPQDETTKVIYYGLSIGISVACIAGMLVQGKKLNLRRTDNAFIMNMVHKQREQSKYLKKTR